jgi:hypothetical protein
VVGLGLLVGVPLAVEVGLVVETGATVTVDVGEGDTVAVGERVGFLDGRGGCGFWAAAAGPAGAETMLTPQVATMANSATASS